MRRTDTKSLRRFTQRHGIFSLTYDDGPGPQLTTRILDLLESRGAHATFFLLGRRAQANPETADRVVAAGHEIGCHSHNHLNAWKTMPKRSTADVERGYDTLERWLPDRCIFRPPYGKITPWTNRVVRRHSSRLGWWTIDSGDTWATLPSVQSVVDRVRRAGGGVVLLHDFDRTGNSATQRAEFVLSVTESLLNLADEIGLRISMLGKFLDEMEQSKE